MYHTLLHIYGPFAIYSFGFFMALGLIVALAIGQRHRLRTEYFSTDTFLHTIFLTVITGLFGSKALYLIQNWSQVTEWDDLLALLHGGFSMLGSLIAVLLFIPSYMKYHSIPFLPFFDLVSLHIPIMQSIGRIGCFLSGCCFGLETDLPWGITYTDIESNAPLCVRLHPTQLYSALSLFTIFCILYFIIQHHAKKPGQLTAWYLFFISVERFVIDFFRGDREFTTGQSYPLLSVHQWIALAFFIGSIILFFYTAFLHHPYPHHQSTKNNS